MSAVNWGLRAVLAKLRARLAPPAPAVAMARAARCMACGRYGPEEDAADGMCPRCAANLYRMPRAGEIVYMNERASLMSVAPPVDNRAARAAFDAAWSLGAAGPVPPSSSPAPPRSVLDPAPRAIDLSE